MKWKHWLSGREKVPGAAVGKEGHAGSFLGHERTYHSWFPGKRRNCKECFQILTSKARFTLFIEWPV